MATKRTQGEGSGSAALLRRTPDALDVDRFMTEAHWDGRLTRVHFSNVRYLRRFLTQWRKPQRATYPASRHRR